MVVSLLLGLLTLAAAYALIALGFVLILNATGAVNFSHGDLVMVGGFAAAALGGRLPVPGLVLLPLLLLAMALLGALIAALAVLPLQRRAPETVLISTIAIGVMLQNAATLIFGPEPEAAPALLDTSDIILGPVRIGTQQVAILGVAALLVLAVHLLFAHTQLGLRMRAAASDHTTAASLGVRVDAMLVVTFAIGTALAGAAGMLLANSFFVSPDSGTDFMLKAYIAVAIGGWGSLRGAVAGAALIACFEVLYPSLPVLLPGLASAGALFSQTGAAIALDIALLLILAIRPRGLFGVAAARPA